MGGQRTKSEALGHMAHMTLPKGARAQASGAYPQIQTKVDFFV
jgi:hypothetical protein